MKLLSLQGYTVTTQWGTMTPGRKENKRRHCKLEGAKSTCQPHNKGFNHFLLRVYEKQHRPRQGENASEENKKQTHAASLAIRRQNGDNATLSSPVRVALGIARGGDLVFTRRMGCIEVLLLWKSQELHEPLRVGRFAHWRISDEPLHRCTEHRPALATALCFTEQCTWRLNVCRPAPSSPAVLGFPEACL